MVMNLESFGVDGVGYVMLMSLMTMLLQVYVSTFDTYPGHSKTF